MLVEQEKHFGCGNLLDAQILRFELRDGLLRRVSQEHAPSRRLGRLLPELDDELLQSLLRLGSRQVVVNRFNFVKILRLH